MKIETKDMKTLVVHVPDAVAARVTREAAADPLWKRWHCSGCGNVEAGVSLNMERLACDGCLDRIRRGQPVIAVKEWGAEWELTQERGEPCSVCGERSGLRAEGRGQSVICGRCLAGAAA